MGVIEGPTVGVRALILVSHALAWPGNSSGADRQHPHGVVASCCGEILRIRVFPVPGLPELERVLYDRKVQPRQISDQDAWYSVDLEHDMNSDVMGRKLKL